MNKIHLPSINSSENNKISNIINSYPKNIKKYKEYNNHHVDKPKFYYKISEKGPTLLKSILQERGNKMKFLLYFYYIIVFKIISNHNSFLLYILLLLLINNCYIYIYKYFRKYINYIIILILIIKDGKNM